MDKNSDEKATKLQEAVIMLSLKIYLSLNYVVAF